MNNKLALPPRISEIVGFYFQNPSISRNDLAKHFGISVQRVSQILNNDKVVNAFPMLAKRKVRSLVPKAVGQLEKLMTQTDNLNVQEKVVSRILDSEKVLEPQTHNVVHSIQTKTIEELKAIIDVSKSIPVVTLDAEIIDADNEDTAA